MSPSFNQRYYIQDGKSFTSYVGVYLRNLSILLVVLGMYIQLLVVGYVDYVYPTFISY